MIEFTTEKGEFVVDEVDNSELAMYKFFDKPKTFRYGIHLQPMFLLSEATEEDAKGVVYKSEAFGLYRNYNKKVEFGVKIEFNTAIESLHSLLTSKGIDIKNGNWYLFKKV